MKTNEIDEEIDELLKERLCRRQNSATLSNADDEKEIDGLLKKRLHKADERSLLYDEWQEMRHRPDYKFTVQITADTLQELRNNRMDSFTENGDPIRGAAVLEIGHVDLEVNIHAACQTAYGKPEDKTPQVSYFCCVKHGETDESWESDDYVCDVRNVDWNADDWKEQLEFDMFVELDKYREAKGYSYDSPN